MRVALIVDNPYRDLPGLVLVAYQLAKQGVTCFLVPLNLQSDELFSLMPDFVLLNYLRKNNIPLAERLHSAGIRFGVLDTEGGFFTDPKTYLMRIAHDEPILSNVTCYCSWGSRLASLLVDGQWYREEQIAVTGSPRFDFYSWPLRDAAIALSVPYVEKITPYVLINGAFPLANPGFMTFEAQAAMLIEQFGYSEEQVQRRRLEQTAIMHEIIHITNKLADKFQEWNFVYRPHPFERLDAYYGLLESRSNIHLKRTGTVDGWLLHATALIQLNCTTAVDATLAGIPVLTPSWIETSADVPIAKALSQHCHSFSEMETAIQAIVASRNERPLDADRVKGILEPWFYSIDGQAFKRVAATIEQQVVRTANPPSSATCAMYYYQTDRKDWPLWARYRRQILKRLSLPKHWSFRRLRMVSEAALWDRSEKHFDSHLIESIVGHVSRALNDGNPRVEVSAAKELGAYGFRHTSGRSVAVFLRDKPKLT